MVVPLADPRGSAQKGQAESPGSNTELRLDLRLSSKATAGQLQALEALHGSTVKLPGLSANVGIALCAFRCVNFIM